MLEKRLRTGFDPTSGTPVRAPFRSLPTPNRFTGSGQFDYRETTE
jgi:hypothetical protein